MFSSATDGKLESKRYRLGRVNNGLSDKTKMTFAVCGWQIRQVSCFVNKISCEKTKRSVMPVIRSSLLMFYGWKYCRHSAFTGREACGIKGTVAYKRTGTGYKRRMRHTVSMKDCEIPHGNMDF